MPGDRFATNTIAGYFLSGCELSSCERLDVCVGVSFTADAPISAFDFPDDYQRHRAQVLPFDRHHRVRDLVNDVLLLLRRENAFHDLNIYQWHIVLPSMK